MRLTYIAKCMRRSNKNAETYNYFAYENNVRLRIVHERTEYLYLLKTSSSGRKKSIAKKDRNVNTKWAGGTTAKAEIHHIPTADPANVTGCSNRSTKNIVDQSRSVFFFCPCGVSQTSSSIGDKIVAQTDKTAPRP